MAFKFAATFMGAMLTGAGLHSFSQSTSTPAAPASASFQKLDANAVHCWEKPKEASFTHKFKPFKLGEIINLAEDVAIFRFLLPNPDDEFNLKACATLQTLCPQGQNTIEKLQRSYTPITPNGTKGYFDLLVKKMENGRMTEYLFGMSVGDEAQFRSMTHKLTYKPNKWKRIGLIGGGTGITPLLQVMQESLLGDPTDTTQLSLLYANQHENKILLEGLLRKYERDYPDRLKLHFTIDHYNGPDPENWKGFIGYINRDMIKKTMPPPSNDHLLLVCGPDPLVHVLTGIPFSVLRAMSGGYAMQPVSAGMNNFATLGGTLREMGYETEQVFRF